MSKRVFWIIEILFWGLLFLSLCSLFVYRYHKKEEQYTKVEIPFDDTDGLIVGSPVKFMGVPIGYISKLKIQNNEAVVSIIITKKDVIIPRGSTASVEFSGLAASKSLELYPPIEKIDHDIYTQSPIRIQNVLENQKNIANNIIEMSNNFNKVIEKNNINQIQRFLNTKALFTEADNFLDCVIDFEDKTQAKLNKQVKSNGKK
jgi:ABC-type transporter Mla subunit MlaD